MIVEKSGLETNICILDLENSRTYRCLRQNNFNSGRYRIEPIRDQDKTLIMKWRNDQIDILRQKSFLTEEEQARYFKFTVASLFETVEPGQLLFSFFVDDTFIGYGGLVHIDWISRHGEVSFLLETSRNSSIELFAADIKQFLELIKQVAFTELGFRKVFTYAYDLRPHLYPVLEASGFVEEARLKDHVFVKDRFFDVLIHSVFNGN